MNSEHPCNISTIWTSVQCSCKYYTQNEGRVDFKNANVLLFLKENEEYVNWTNKKADTAQHKTK